jgi:hypothetical protein
MLQRSPQRRPRYSNFPRRGSLPNFLTHRSNAHVHVPSDAIFNFRVFILAEEISLLPLVRLFADVHELRCKHMPALGAPAVTEVAIKEFGLRPEMVLRQRLGVGLEVGTWNWLASFAVKCRLSRRFACAWQCKSIGYLADQDVSLHRGHVFWQSVCRQCTRETSTASRPAFRFQGRTALA